MSFDDSDPSKDIDNALVCFLMNDNEFPSNHKKRVDRQLCGEVEDGKKKGSKRRGIDLCNELEWLDVEERQLDFVLLKDYARSDDRGGGNAALEPKMEVRSKAQGSSPASDPNRTLEREGDDDGEDHGSIEVSHDLSSGISSDHSSDYSSDYSSDSSSEDYDDGVNERKESAVERHNARERRARGDGGEEETRRSLEEAKTILEEAKVMHGEVRDMLVEVRILHERLPALMRDFEAGLRLALDAMEDDPAGRLARQKQQAS
ncbi:hypothetical protein VMCG_09435 [Cytospora schulzeri]|uniref:Uncharacterized protein n=1 Tax=Cytospora schulzeri TaxID=448051 RepID=A0A423VKH0_9PEZI|nr:hypothetical protein VMCG_09435 [Valsa malicola]